MDLADRRIDHPFFLPVAEDQPCRTVGWLASHRLSLLPTGGILRMERTRFPGFENVFSRHLTPQIHQVGTHR